MPAEQPLRVLVVDDSADDAELVRFALQDAGLSIELRRVYDEPGLRAALAGFAPDVVVSDVNIPGFDGARALQLTGELAPGVRTVCVTGSLIAGQCPPNAEATLLKDEFDRLPALLRDWFD
ncbi:MAG: response regulator [Pseudomonas sp.]|nr:response regulator [Pseudomonas sp.]